MISGKAKSRAKCLHPVESVAWQKGDEYSRAGGVACEEVEKTHRIYHTHSPIPPSSLCFVVPSFSPCLTRGKGNRGRWELGSQASNFMLMFNWGRKSWKLIDSQNNICLIFPWGIRGHWVQLVTRSPGFNVSPGSGFLHYSPPGKRDCLFSTSSLSPMPNSETNLGFWQWSAFCLRGCLATGPTWLWLSSSPIIRFLPIYWLNLCHKP